ncbi:hypothetical protein AX14_003629 [Amanita brunnescens Koide BX004]|nr:hypothetical protein AX14_003629 [Amanita brunnescens Koide BX004]
MAPVRVRHSGGVDTIEIALDDDAVSVQALQQQIYAVSGILPSRQQLKSGYPPRILTTIPDLPISSLGIVRGDQIIVTDVAPQRPPIPQNRPSEGPVYVDTNGGVLIHRVVPDDNSCLFSAVSLIFEQDMKSQKMREIVAEGIRRNPDTYNKAILGMEPDRYIATILKPSTWGGAIELTILATHFNTEITSIDVETGRVDRFTPQQDRTGTRGILLYSGIHYDAVSLAPFADATGEWHQTLFPVSAEGDNDAHLVAARKLADILRAKRAYTNTATFDLRCEVCGTGLKGEKEARAHAEQTGHVRFGEY